MAVKNFRIGNDLVVLWAICNRDGSPYNLANKQVRLFVMNERGRKEVAPVLTALPDGSVNNVIRWDFLGIEQRVTGLYTLSVEIFTDADKKSIKKDYCEAFCLVGSSSLEDEDLADNISDGGELTLSSSLDVIQLTIPRIEIGTNGNWIIDGIDSNVSALGGGPGLVNKIYDYLGFGRTYDPESVIDTFNAHAINSLYLGIKEAEQDIRNAESAIGTLESEVELLKQWGGGSGSGGNIGEETLAVIMNAISAKADKTELSKYLLLTAPLQKITGDIEIDGNLIVRGDMASAGEGDPNTQVGLNEEQLQAYLDLHKYVTENDVKNLIPEVNLSNYYTKQEVDTKISTVSGSISGIVSSLIGGKADRSELSKYLLLEASEQTIKGDIVIDGNLVVKGDMASMGVSENTGGGGSSTLEGLMDVALGSLNNGDLLSWNGSAWINIKQSTIVPNLTDYATKGYVSNALVPYATKDNVTSALGGYLPLSGGVIDGTLKVSNSHGEIAFNNTTKISTGWLLYQGGSLWKVTDNLWRNEYTLLHSDNYSDYALPKIGGRITSNTLEIGNSTNYNSAYFRVVVNATSSVDYGTYLRHYSAGSFRGLRITPYAVQYDNNGTISELIHAGNIEDYAVKTYGTDMPADIVNYVGYGKIDTGWKYYGPSATFGISSYFFQFQKEYDTTNLVFRSYNNGTYSDWRTIIHSGNIGSQSVASANKIITTDKRIVVESSVDDKYVDFGGYTSTAGYDAYISGKNIYFRYGTSLAKGLILNSSGNVTIGASDLAGTSAKLYVDGNSYTNGNARSYTARSNQFNTGDSVGLYAGSSYSSALTAADIALVGTKAFFNGNVLIGTTSDNGAKLQVVGDAIITGDLASGSDIRFKNIVENTSLDINDIANAPLFTFKWNDREDSKVHLGTSAQYWEDKSDGLVTGEDFKTLNYASLGVAMGISLAKKAVNHEERIKVLEERINELETENRRLQYGS